MNSSTALYTASVLDNWFVNMCRHVWEFGEVRPGRNGNTRSIFGHSLTLNLADGFPILSAKKTNFLASVAETLAFIQGANNSETFKALGCNFWDANANSEYWLKNQNRIDLPGSLGRVYGVQWREWQGVEANGTIRYVDQLSNLLNGLKNDPYGRRHIVTAWQPAELDQMALPPCHTFFQVYCHTDNSLSLQMYQRSADLFLGVPYNVTSYALIAHILASMTGRTVRNLNMVFGDLHLYETHELEDSALTKLFANNAAESWTKTLPKLTVPNYLGLDFSDDALWQSTEGYSLSGYNHKPFIPAKMVE